MEFYWPILIGQAYKVTWSGEVHKVKPSLHTHPLSINKIKIITSIYGMVTGPEFGDWLVGWVWL